MIILEILLFDLFNNTMYDDSCNKLCNFNNSVEMKIQFSNFVELFLQCAYLHLLRISCSKLLFLKNIPYLMDYNIVVCNQHIDENIK